MIKSSASALLYNGCPHSWLATLACYDSVMITKYKHFHMRGTHRKMHTNYMDVKSCVNSVNLTTDVEMF